MNDEHCSVPKVFNYLIDKPELVPAKNFLKQDIHSSPKFAFNPQSAKDMMQMRFEQKTSKGG